MDRGFHRQHQQLLLDSQRRRQEQFDRQQRQWLLDSQRQRRAVGYLRASSFDRRVPGQKTKQEEIPHTFWGGPDEGSIRVRVEQYMRAGWSYVARKEVLGLLSGKTILTFQQL